MTEYDDDRTGRATSRALDAVIRGRSGSFVAWFVFLVGSLGVLAALDIVALRTYAVSAFLCLLVTSEVYAPADPDSVWWGRLQWVKAGGWIVLGYVVFERVAAVFL